MITKSIVELLTAEPNLSAEEIIKRLNTRADSTKQTLYHLHKQGRIKREKKSREGQFMGPKAVYCYCVNSKEEAQQSNE